MNKKPTSITFRGVAGNVYGYGVIAHRYCKSSLRGKLTEMCCGRCSIGHANTFGCHPRDVTVVNAMRRHAIAGQEACTFPASKVLCVNGNR